ncbi:hypothetical protein AAC387_Pa01g3523 [Persea americana]
MGPSFPLHLHIDDLEKDGGIGRIPPDGLVPRPRHILRRRDCIRHLGWRLWLWKPIRCVESSACYWGSPFTTVTATNLCPPNWSEDSNAGGWCNPPRTHFDMSKPAFMKIADWKAGIVPVMYRRVPCVKRGGLEFSFQGNGYWLLVYVMNVGGGGNIGGIWVKGSRTGWIAMTHNRGASYRAFSTLGGQSLSFKITSYTTKETIMAWNVAPSDWNVGVTYKASVNFH